MMPFKDGVGQVIELSAALSLTNVALAMRLSAVNPCKPRMMTAVEPQFGQLTPSGQRSLRTSSKHLASSTKTWMFSPWQAKDRV